MWTYQQISGKLFNPDGAVVGIGYSGYKNGVNNPAMQGVPFTGPIPCGFYSVGVPYDSVHSPFTLPLSPFQENEMFGRSEFLCHGDLVDQPGQRLASRGCIILSRDVRESIWNSSDHVIHVVSGQESE